MSSSSSAFSSKEKEEQEQQHQVRAVKILQMELFQQLVKELKALAERAAVGLRSAAVRRGEEAYPAAAPFGGGSRCGGGGRRGSSCGTQV